MIRCGFPLWTSKTWYIKQSSLEEKLLSSKLSHCEIFKIFKKRNHNQVIKNDAVFHKELNYILILFFKICLLFKEKFHGLQVFYFMCDSQVDNVEILNVYMSHLRRTHLVNDGINITIKASACLNYSCPSIL